MIKKIRRNSVVYYTPQRKRKFRSPATFTLIILNVLVYMAVILISQLLVGQSFMSEIALQPSSAFQKPWTFLTSMFMHSPLVIHLIVNMLSLFFLGSFLESLIKPKRFVALYLISGLIAGLFFVLFSYYPLSAIPGIGISDANMMAVGASGAIFGIGGALAVLTPKIPVYLMFIPIAMPLWLGILLMFGILWIITAGAGLPIGNAAHLGGLITGLIYGFYLRMKHRKKVAVLDRHFR